MAMEKNLLPEKEYHAWDKNRVESLDRRSSADPAGGGGEIGDGTAIGAGSVVTRSIPPRCVAVGNPCRIIRRL